MQTDKCANVLQESGESTSATVCQKVNQHVFCTKLEEVEVCCF